MRHELLVGLIKTLCLGTAIHALGYLSIDPVIAQATDSTSTQQVAPAIPPTIRVPATLPLPIEPPSLPVVDNTASTMQIISPTPNSVLDLPATAIVIKYRIGTKVELKVNNRLVDNHLIGRTETDSKTNVITQTWYGVPLTSGKNVISISSENGEVATSAIQVTGTPTKLQLSTIETRVPADGRSLVTIEGQLLDINNNPSKQDSIVTLYSSAGEFAGIDAEKDQPGFQVLIKNGKFTAKLRSSLDAQVVRIRATNLDLEANTQVKFETNLRSPIATGLIDVRLGARGIDYYRSLAEFLPIDRNNSTQLQIRGQAFTTGKIGDWSLTGALNSDRPLNKVCDNTDRLFRNTSSINCESLYPIYGDTSKVDVLTPSRDSVFIKLESSAGVVGNTQNMVMWGDYRTNEFATGSQQFTATSRNLHGAKLNYNTGNLLMSGFYGDNVQGFQRDNIAPDGTSGTYFLSQRLLVGGSENLTIESEQLDRPGTLTKVEILNRGLDYDIDYDRGTILLRRPLLRTGIAEDGTILVRRLVATYQFANGSNSNIYGGRAQYTINRTSGRESWIGASWTKENLGVRDFSIIGTDALISLGPSTNIIAEYARSTNNNGLGDSVTGSAIRVEGQSRLSDNTNTHAYYRSSDTGFANNATISFVPGQTRYGADISTKLGDRTTLKVQVDREENRGTPPIVNGNISDLITPRNPVTGRVDNDLTTTVAGIQQRVGNIVLDLDYVNRNRQDRLAIDPNQTNVSSSQIRSRASYPLASNITLRAQNETNLSNQQDVVYPNRSNLGIDWTVYPGIKLGISQNYISSTEYGNTNYTSFDFDSSYNLTPNTKVTGRYSLSPFQSIGSAGIQQGFVLSPGLKLDLNYERVVGSGTTVATGAGQQFAQPYSSGQTAASLPITGGENYGIGINYTNNPNFQANARYERRNSDLLGSTNISAGITGKLSPALSALVKFQQSSAANQVIRDTKLGDTANFKVGLAYRNPASDEFNGLLSYQYRRNPALLPTSILTSVGTGSEDHTLALEGIYAPNSQWEFAGKYALRNSTSYLDRSLTAGNTIGITQLRATYRLGYNWDLTSDVRWLTQFASGRSQFGGTLEAGYYLTPDLRLSGGYSLGSADDPNGSRNAQGAYIGLTVKVNELFGGFGRQQSPTPKQESKSTSPQISLPTSNSQLPASTQQ